MTQSDTEEFARKELETRKDPQVSTKLFAVKTLFPVSRVPVEAVVSMKILS